MVFSFILRPCYILYLRCTSPNSISLKAFVNRQTELEGRNVLHARSVLSGSKVGYGTYVGSDSLLPNCSVGRYCSISNNVEVLPYTHPTKKFVSTHPAFFSMLCQAGFTFARHQAFLEELSVDNEAGGRFAVIGNDVWIGSHVLLKGGVTIGDGAIIAAGAVVVSDVQPYSIVAGIPAKVVRMRFDETQIMKLMSFRWWSRPEVWLRENVEKFAHIDEFLKFIENEFISDSTS